MSESLVFVKTRDRGPMPADNILMHRIRVLSKILCSRIKLSDAFRRSTYALEDTYRTRGRSIHFQYGVPQASWSPHSPGVTRLRDYSFFKIVIVTRHVRSPRNIFFAQMIQTLYLLSGGLRLCHTHQCIP